MKKNETKDWPKDNRKTSRRGKKVATPEAVAEAVKRIVAREERPTIYRVMQEIKGGSMTTISRLLKQIKSEVTVEQAKKIISRQRVFAPGIICAWFPYHRRIVIPFSKTLGEISPAKEIQLWKDMNPFLEDEEYQVASKVANTIAEVYNNEPKEDITPGLECLETCSPQKLWDIVQHRQRKVIVDSKETLLLFHTQCPKYDFMLVGFVESGNEMVFMGEDRFRQLNQRIAQNIYRKEEMDEILERIRKIEKKLNLPQIKAQRKAIWFNKEIEDQIQRTLQFRDVYGLPVCTGEVMVGAQSVTIAIAPAYNRWKPIDDFFYFENEKEVEAIFETLNPGASLGLINLARQISCEVAHWCRRTEHTKQEEFWKIPIGDACKTLETLMLDEKAETQPRCESKYFWAYFRMELREKTYHIPCIWNEETETVEDLWEDVISCGISYEAAFEAEYRIYCGYNPGENMGGVIRKGKEIILQASGFRVRPANFALRPSRPRDVFDWKLTA